MQQVLSVVNQLASTSSRNEKESILKKNQSNELLKDVFYFVFNPYILTGLSTKKISKKTKEKGIVLNTFDDMKNYILKLQSGKLKKVFLVQGEDESAIALSEAIKAKISVDTVIPKMGESFEL